MTTKEILSEAMGLSVGERARLAHELLLSLEDSEPSVDEAWREEIVRRSREVAEGRVELVDWETVEAELLQDLGSER